MFVLELAILGAVFYGVYKLMMGKEVPVQDVPTTADRDAQLRRKYFFAGVDRALAMDIKQELARRGVTDFPDFGENGWTDAEVMAKLQLLLEQTEYIPRNNDEPEIDVNLMKNPFPVSTDTCQDDTDERVERAVGDAAVQGNNYVAQYAVWKSRQIPVMANAPN
jgi:hypothetical protein